MELESEHTDRRNEEQGGQYGDQQHPVRRKSDDGLKAAEKNTDGSETQIVFTRKEKPRCLSCNFQKGKISGTFTALLLGGGDATSVECTLDVNGLGLFTKPEKLLNERLEMLRQTLGA